VVSHVLAFGGISGWRFTGICRRSRSSRAFRSAARYAKTWLTTLGCGHPLQLAFNIVDREAHGMIDGLCRLMADELWPKRAQFDAQADLDAALGGVRCHHHVRAWFGSVLKPSCKGREPLADATLFCLIEMEAAEVEDGFK
jgi:hypothetical protein